MAISMLIAVALAACSGGRGPAETLPVESLRILSSVATTTLQVEVARTPEARQRGLMGRRSLPEDRGMAFLFGAPARDGFWMKDTLIPLQIAFWDEGGRIVTILDMDPCTADPCPVYRPDASYVGALEVNEGFFDRHEVKVGDRIELG